MMMMMWLLFFFCDVLSPELTQEKLVGIWVYLWGWMAYSIPASNISYPMQVNPGLFALRSTLALFCSVLYFKGSTPWGECPRFPCLLSSVLFSTRRKNKQDCGRQRNQYFPLPGSLRRCLQSLSFFSGSRSHWISPSQFQLPLSSTDSSIQRC